VGAEGIAELEAGRVPWVQPWEARPLLDEADIAPSSLTFECVERLARGFQKGPPNRIGLVTIARRFAAHLIDIGVA
jgi:hypothetical protein